jgi:hypothetical protein
MFRLYSGLSSSLFECRIATRPTVEPSAAATLRAELLAQIANAQFDLDATATTGDKALIALAEAQRQELAGLLRAIAGTGPAGLTAMRAQVAAAASGSAGLAQQARSASSMQAERAELAAASTASRQQVQSLMRDLHRFDSFLSFASPEEEAEYRRREAERRAYIDKQHGRGTPEGDLNANAAALGQLADAEAHGAGASPDFQSKWDDLSRSYDRLHSNIRQAGGSTREADEVLARDVRQTLRRNGRTDQEIDAMLAAQGGDPLKLAQAEMARSPAQAQTAQPNTEIPQRNELEDAMAALRAAGVTAPVSPTERGSMPSAAPQFALRDTSIGRG